MSDGFPSRSCAGAILSRGEVDEAAGRFLRRPSGFLQRSQDGRSSDSVDPGVKGLVDNDEGGAVDCCAGT